MASVYDARLSVARLLDGVAVLAVGRSKLDA